MVTHALEVADVLAGFFLVPFGLREADALAKARGRLVFVDSADFLLFLGWRRLGSLLLKGRTLSRGYLGHHQRSNEQY